MTAAKKTAKKAVRAKRVRFVILVSLETEDGEQYAVPRNIPGFMHPGDTVSYESPDGEVSVKFEKNQDGTKDPAKDPVHTSPYVDATGKDLQTVKSGVVLNVGNAGTYLGKCSITRILDDGSRQKIVWRREDRPKQVSSKQDRPKQVELTSGGNHVVKQPPSGP